MEAWLKSPDIFGVIMVVFFFGGISINLAYVVLWQRSQILFWLVSALIVAGFGYLVVTGSAANIARALWPIAFDEIRGQEFRLQIQCQRATELGIMLIVAPMTPIIVLLALFEFRRSWPATARPRSTILLRRFLAMILFRYPWTKTLFMRTWPKVVLGVVFVVLCVSPVPENLARLVFSEDALKLPDHCRQNRPADA